MPALPSVGHNCYCSVCRILKRPHTSVPRDPQGAQDPLDFPGAKGRLTTNSCSLQLHDNADQPAPGNLIPQELTHNITLPFPASSQLSTRNESLNYLKFKIMSSHLPMKTCPEKSKAYNRILETVNTTSVSSHSSFPHHQKVDLNSAFRK